MSDWLKYHWLDYKIVGGKALFVKLTESCYDVRKILSEVFQLLDCRA